MHRKTTIQPNLNRSLVCFAAELLFSIEYYLKVIAMNVKTIRIQAFD